MAIGFNDSDMFRQTADARMKAGAHALMITEAKRHQKDGSDNIMCVLSVKKLKEVDNGASAFGKVARMWLTFPVQNLDVEDHEIPTGYSIVKTTEMFAAFFPDEVFAYPQWNRDDKCSYYRGKEVAEEDLDAAKKESRRSLVDKILEIWGDDGEGLQEALGNLQFFANVTYEEDSTFPRFEDPCGEQPANWDLEADALEYVGEAPKPQAKAKAPARKTKARGRGRK